MRRLLVLAAVGLAALPSAASAKGFSDGVAAAEVRATSALVWTRADHAGTVTLEVSRSARFRGAVVRRSLRARRAADHTVQVRLTRLRPGARYHYRFTAGKRRSERGAFRTAPRPGANRTVRFAWTGDADPVKAPDGSGLAFAPFAVFDRMRRAGNDFNVNLGDTIYSDTDSKYERTDPIAITVASKRAKYRAMLQAANLRRLRAAAGMYNHWDDHEFLNDFAIGQTRYPTRFGTQDGQPPRIVTVDGHKLYRDGVKAFREYMPVTYSKRDGIYRSFRWGRNLEVFFLDERSFRDVGADDGPVCDNPAGSGNRDLAPTTPQRIRTTFALLLPQLAFPPPPACVARIDDPGRTLLGRRQYAMFTKAIKRSKATWKVIMNELPIQQIYVDPYDRWEGYAAERARLLTYLRDHVKRAVFLTADVHANLVGDARFKTLEAGGPVNSGITEVTTGPSGTDTFATDIDDTAGNPNAGTLVNSFFLRRRPPDGPGITCSNLDVFSYGQVTVTARRLTIALRDAQGKPVRDPDGKVCGPYVLER
jgi:phosphodiesterase/alkaline phosphatase D-like protein